MDKTIYRQSKVMGFDHKVINLVTKYREPENEAKETRNQEEAREETEAEPEPEISERDAPILETEADPPEYYS